jgi:hypothetical protein
VFPRAINKALLLQQEPEINQQIQNLKAEIEVDINVNINVDINLEKLIVIKI